MNKKFNYLPILKAKAGEYQALTDLPKEIKATICPLIEAFNIPWDYENDEVAKSIDEHFENFAEKLEKSWGTEEPFYIDIPYELFSGLMKDKKHVLASIFHDTRSKKLQAIPVIGLNRPESYNLAVKEIIATDKRGVLIRVEREDLQDPKFSNRIDEVISELGIKQEEADILLDYKDVLPGQESLLSAALKENIASFSDPAVYRNIIFAATSFPKSLAGFDKNTIGQIPRTEWLTWNLVNKNKDNFAKLPIYGDYGISHPELNEMNPKLMSMSANLRYTSDLEWIVIKGSNVRKDGFGQFAGLCKSMAALSEYKGKEHCLGDAYINDCKDGNAKTGNASKWRWIGSIHHLTVVSEQLSIALAS